MNIIFLLDDEIVYCLIYKAWMFYSKKKNIYLTFIVVLCIYNGNVKRVALGLNNQYMFLTNI